MAIEATGGTESTIEIEGVSYRLHVFAENGDFNVTAAGDVDYLIVGGGASGGGGGSSVSGGGGAGGVRSGSISLGVGSYPIVAGPGGASVSGSSNIGNNGSDSSAFGVTALGGGGGGRFTATAGSGGSGGGAGAEANGTGSAGAGTEGQGNDGGAAATGGGTQANSAAGGGGGAGAPGEAGVSGTSSGAGGVGLDFSGTFGTGVGASGWFAGGGGGSGHNATAGAGGTGGGGEGGQSGAGTAGTNGTGGGGGGGNSNQASGAGGRGIVLVRYALAPGVDPVGVGRAGETNAGNAVTWAKTVHVGPSSETNTAQAAVARVQVRVAVAKASESSSANAVATAKAIRQLIRPAHEKAHAAPLSSGLPPFWWAVAPVATRVPAPRRLRPLVLVDRVDGAHYIIMRNATNNLIRLELHVPRRYDEVFDAWYGPTLELDGRVYRIYIENGALLRERALYDVRTRPVLFGKVARPKPDEPRYELTLTVHS